MRLTDLVLILGLLAVFTLAGCIGEKADSANIQTVRLYGPTEDKDYELTVTLPDDFYIDQSSKPTLIGSETLSAVKILNKNQTGSMSVALLSMNEPKRSIFMLDDLSAFVEALAKNEAYVESEADFKSSADKKIIGRDGREWRYWIRLAQGTAPIDAWFYAIPMDDTRAILISSYVYPQKVNDELINSMQFKPATSKK